MTLLAVLPVVVIFLVLVLFRRPADITGLIGWAFTALLAWLVFRTGWPVILRASLSGLAASLPISLVVATSILQMTLMQKTGALARIIVLLKTISRGNQIVQILIINVGIGTLLTALGAVPVSILPPIMLALGYSAFAAIALPAIGYDSLCTYALLGTPVVIFADVASKITGNPVGIDAVGIYFARFMPVITTLIALGMLWIVGRWRMVVQGLVPAILSGLAAGFIAIGMNAIGLVTLTGIASGAGVVLVMVAYLLMLRQPVLDRSQLTPADVETEKGMSLFRALSPWLLLILFCLVTNEPWLGIRKFLFSRVEMPLHIVPGAPDKLRVFWQAYWWILVSTIVSIPFLRASGRQLRETLAVWWKRAPRPVLAAAVFFAIAFVINHSGKSGVLSERGAWTENEALNMVAIVAHASAWVFGRFYAGVSPYLGLLAGFISGSESSAIAMLTKLHYKTADAVGRLHGQGPERIAVSALVIAAASAIGGGLASVISPAKLQNAAAAIDRIGLETEVIRTAVVIAVVVVLAVAGLALVWA
jgi:lactate permease